MGHHAAKLDPLEMAERTPVPALELNYHHLSDADRSRKFFASTSFNGPEMTLDEIYQSLRKTYCGSIGIEYMHISNTEEVEWIQQRMESVHGRLNLNADKKVQILKDLIAADGLERYLGTRYVGTKKVLFGRRRFINSHDEGNY